ncbi:MAG: hypothetical protein GX641_02695 [Mollicutes bacterium]|nr:hypothetical protein [Mollicutes bacterium]
MEKNKKRNYYLVSEIPNEKSGENELSILFQCDLQTIDELTTCFDNENDFVNYLNDKFLLSCDNLHLTYNHRGINEKDMIYKEDRAIVTSKTLYLTIFDHINKNCIWKNGGIDNLDPYVGKQRKNIINGEPYPRLYAKNIINHIKDNYLNYRNCCLIFKKDPKFSDPKFSNYRTSFQANSEYIDEIINKMQIKLKNPLFKDYINQQKLIQKQKELEQKTLKILEQTKENEYEIEKAEKELNNPDVIRARGLTSEDEELYDNNGRSR